MLNLIVVLLEKVMIFIFAEWSGPAHISRMTMIDWENQTNFEVPLFELDIDESNFISEWIYKEAKDKGGWGSLAWLKNGVVYWSEINAGEFSISEIERKTAEIFGN